MVLPRIGTGLLLPYSKGWSSHRAYPDLKGREIDSIACWGGSKVKFQKNMWGGAFFEKCNLPHPHPQHNQSWFRYLNVTNRIKLVKYLLLTSQCCVIYFSTVISKKCPYIIYESISCTLSLQKSNSMMFLDWIKFHNIWCLRKLSSKIDPFLTKIWDNFQ